MGDCLRRYLARMNMIYMKSGSAKGNKRLSIFLVKEHSNFNSYIFLIQWIFITHPPSYVLLYTHHILKGENT